MYMLHCCCRASPIIAHVIKLLALRFLKYAIDNVYEVHTCMLLRFNFFAFEGAKFLAAMTSAVEWYKSHAHNDLVPVKIIQICMC